jgi:hypothetical protein
MVLQIFYRRITLIPQKTTSFRRFPKKRFTQANEIETIATKVTQIKLLKVLLQEMPSRSSKINATIDASNAEASSEVIGLKDIQITPTLPAERLPKQQNVPLKNSNFIGLSKLLKYKYSIKYS